jgi:alpha-D-ribose 1-methylphosphonate 5-triphosphate synthase subunit PhnH
MDGMSDAYEVIDAQRMFKSIVNAFSRPFKIYNIKNNSEPAPPNEDNATIKALCFVFLDNTVSFHVHDDKAFAGDIREMTYSNNADIEKANFVIIKDISAFNVFEKISQGTLLDPHKGATVIIAVPKINGETRITAEGPGINGKMTCLVDQSIVDCLNKIAELDIEYPKGFELIFATPQGDILAVPRRVKIFKEAG